MAAADGAVGSSCCPGRSASGLAAGLGACAAAVVLLCPAAVNAREVRGWRRWLREHAREESWLEQRPSGRLTRGDTVAAIEAARAYLLNHQRADGNFDYEYDLVRREVMQSDHSVRQAAAAWVLASLCRDRPTTATRQAAVRALDFFFRCTLALPGGGMAPVYPGDDSANTGTVAFVCLALIDFIRAIDAYPGDEKRGFYEQWLTQYLGYLESMELSGGSWQAGRLAGNGEVIGDVSPYSDGECLLAYCKAAKYMGRRDLIPKIEVFAPNLLRKYTVDAWEVDEDSDLTKGFFQWGCMAFAEYVGAGWQESETIGDGALALAWWMIHEHAIRLRRRNTAYAVEGLLSAAAIAGGRGDTAAAERLRQVSADTLLNLSAWQVGGPVKFEPRLMPEGWKPYGRAIGGILSGDKSGVVRIDIVQHQLHAYLLALEHVFPEQ